MPAVSPPSKSAKLIVFSIMLLVGLGLTYGELRGLFSAGIGTLVSLGYISLIVVLVAVSGIVPLPQGNRATPLRARVTPFAKAGAWLLASLLWIAVVVRLVPNTVMGATILLGPFAIIFGVSVYFFAKGVFGLLGQRSD